MSLREDPLPRKRPRDSSSSSDHERSPTAKRRKASIHNYPPEFWDALSKITLTRKALREFDRRTTEEKTTKVAGSTRKTTRLLRSDTRRLRDFATSGGPDLSNIRGYADRPQVTASMSKSTSAKGKRSRDSGLPSSNYSTKTTTTGPYDPQFRQMLIDNGVYPDGYRTVEGARPPKPGNIQDLRQMLSQTRPSLSPSRFPESEFEDFQDMNRAAQSEQTAMSSVLPIITGVKDRLCETQENKQFNNLEKFDPNLRAPQPDKYYGARPVQIDPQVRADLSKYIVPSNSTSLPAAPNYFFEGKSAAGRPDVAQLQLTNDMGHGTRGLFELQNYRKETPEYDGNAYTLGATYHPGTGTLQVYATHPRQSASGRTEYHMTQLDGYQMTGNIETCRRGVAAFRNSRDFTKEQRDLLIAGANAVA